MGDFMTLGAPAMEKIARTIIVYLFLIAGLRVFGKRELGQLNPLDFIVLLLLSNTVQNAIIGNDNSLGGGLLGALVLFIVNDIFVRISYTRPHLRRLVEGRPEVLVHEGRIIKAALARNLITAEELVAAARKQGIQHLGDVERATLEVSGALSFTAREPSAADKFRADVLTRLEAIEKRLPAAAATLLLLAALPIRPAHAQAATDVWIVDARETGGRLALGVPTNVTRRPGYDNQPSFTPDGRSLLYTSIGADGEADSWSIALPAGAPRRLTRTAIGVYSPTVTPDGRSFSVIRVELDSTQRLWKFPLAGGEPSLVLERIKPVGYHAWVDDHTLALFILGGGGGPATLQLADTRTGNAEVIARNIGQALVRQPGRDVITFVQMAGDSGRFVTEFDVRTKVVRRLYALPDGANYLAWTAGGTLLTAAGSSVYRRGEDGWDVVADLAASGVRGITRLAASPMGDRIAFVAADPPRP